MPADFFEDAIGDVAFGQQGQGFGPGQGGAFAVIEEWGFAPGVQGVDALFAFAVGARVLVCMSRQ